MISKKELLEITGISYGQLYRWKREGLIPEDWFIKKSSYTGQETYFPKEKMIERVTTIQRLKDQYSLEELAKILSPDVKDNINVDLEYVQNIKGIDFDVVEIYKNYKNSNLTYFDFVLILAFTKIKETLKLSLKELEDFINEHHERLQKCGNTQYLMVITKMRDAYYVMLFKESMVKEMSKEDLQLLLDPKMKEVAMELSLSALNDMFRKNNKHLF